MFATFTKPGLLICLNSMGPRLDRPRFEPPGRRNRAIVYQFTQMLCEFGSGYFAGAECGEMLRAHLAVDDAEFPGAQLSGKRDEGNLRRVAYPGEH